MTLRELQARVNQLVAENDLSADGAKANDLPVAACLYKVVRGKWVRDAARPLSSLYRTPLTLKNGTKLIELTVKPENF